MTIYISHDGDELTVDLAPKTYTAAQIKAKAEIPAGYMLYSQVDGPPMPLPDAREVEIEGCESFLTQVEGGGSS